MKIASWPLALVPLLFVPVDQRAHSPSNGNSAPTGSCSAESIFTDNMARNVQNCLVRAGTADSWQLAGGSDNNGVTGIQYVSSSGNDSNDGKRWGTAKLTVYAALEALPGGSSSSPITAGAGTVYVGPGVSVGASDGKGLRFVGAASTEYSNPATGWMKISGAISLVCQNGQTGSANSHIPQCSEQWGATNSYPAVQLNGTASSFSFYGFQWQYQGTAITLGIDSTGSRNNGGAQNINFKGCSGSGGRSAVGWGPQVDIGSNVFWVFFDDSTFYGSLEAWKVNLSRSSNVVTASVVSGGFGGRTHDLPNGANVSIRNTIGDTSFNGTFVIQSVLNDTTFTYKQTGPNASLSDAAALGDKVFGITVNPTTANGTGSGLIEVNRMVATGIKFYDGANGGSMLIRDFTQEGTLSIDDPPGAWFTLRSGHGGGYVNHIEMADSGVNASAVVVDGTQSPDPPAVFGDFLYSGNSCLSDGPITITGPIFESVCPNNGLAAGATPFRSGARGVINGVLAAQEDDSRRSFSPPTVRYSNIASTASSGWTLSNPIGVTTTTGVTAPDGTDGATSYSTNGVSGNVAFEHGSISISVGDYFIFGVWLRSANDFALDFYLPPADLANTYIAYPKAGAIDGQWIWTWGIAKITSARTSPVTVEHYTPVTSASSISAYAPIMIHIPSGTVSDNEAYEIAEHLQTYGSNCLVGTICQLPAQTLAFGGTGQFFGRLTHSNTANRFYAFPDATGKIPYFTGTPSGCAVWGTGGQIGGTNVNCETILTGRVTTTAAARDVVTVTGATSLSHCSLTATNASAAIHITGTYISDYALNRVTVTHATVASMTYDLLCTPN